MKFILDNNKSIMLSMDSCKLSKGLHTTLYLNGLGFWNLQPKFAFMFGGAEAFCKAWACFMKVDFDGDVENFYKHFDFDIIEKSDQLTKLIQDLVNRDIEPVEEADVTTDDEKPKKTVKRKR
jgi:hypothetical protein